MRAMIEHSIAQNGRCHILDLGGSDYYWNLHLSSLDVFGDKIAIYIVNNELLTEPLQLDPRLIWMFSDATNPATYADVDYDIIHSNSVIEHVGPWDKIAAMARLIEATGKPYFVQTPNFWFPLEPHFRSIGWQFLPMTWRAARLCARRCGFYQRSANYNEAMQIAESIRLLSGGEMQRLFPQAQIRKEWFGPLVKSVMAVSDHGAVSDHRAMAGS